ncbi:MAG: hypothetical protein AAB489_03700 [Patescibacteria group bacterium]
MTPTIRQWERQQEKKQLKEAANLIVYHFQNEFSKLGKHERKFLSCLRDINAFLEKNTIQPTFVPILRKIAEALSLYNHNHRVLKDIERLAYCDIPE